MNEELDRLLDKIVTLEHNCQMNNGPDVDSDPYVGHDHILTENVPSLREFLDLLEVVGCILEILGAKK